MILVPALIAVLLQAPPPTPTPTPAKAADPEKDQFQILEHHVSTAIQKKDVAALDALLAKDFAFSAFLEERPPLVLNRQEWLKTSEHYHLLGFAIRHLAVRVFGNVAVVRLSDTDIVRHPLVASMLGVL